MDGLLGVAAGIIIDSYEMDHSLIPDPFGTSKFSHVNPIPLLWNTPQMVPIMWNHGSKGVFSRGMGLVDRKNGI